MNQEFLELPKPELKELTDFSLVPEVYEREIAKRNGGLNLQDNKQLKALDKVHLEHYESQLPYLSNYTIYPVLKIKELIEKYNQILAPCSLSVSSIDSLLEHALYAYQISYAHYVLGKNRNINGCFPNHCCGVSSWNVLFSLFNQGYPMTSLAHNMTYDHVYLIVPFVIEDKKQQGTIVLDPTSDQLWKGLQRPPRNHLFITSNFELDYNTQWRGGSNLYPENIIDIGSIRKMLENINSREREFYIEYGPAKSNVSSYLQDAFRNPIPFNSYNSLRPIVKEK